LIPLLLSNWKLVIMGLLVAAIGVQTLRLDYCQKARAEDQAKITVLGERIKEQNRAVEALAAESARKQATSAQALRKAEERAKVWDGQARRLTALLTAPKPEGAGCQEAWTAIRSSR
jgi:hypothetical protein